MGNHFRNTPSEPARPPAVRSKLPTRRARSEEDVSAPQRQEQIAPRPEQAPALLVSPPGEKGRLTSPTPVPTSPSPSLPSPAPLTQGAEPVALARMLRSRWLPLLGGILALGFAWRGESLVRAGDKSHWSLLLYILGITLFAWSAWALPSESQAAALPSRRTQPFIFGRLRSWQTLAVGVGLAVTLNLIALFLVGADLASAAGAWLWLLSIIVLLVTGGLVRGWGTWPARWGVLHLPKERRWVFALLGLIAAVMAAQALRWWCIVTLGPHWSTRVLVVPGLPLVNRGPYARMRHPNYVAVVVEGIALPLVHTAWVTAVVFTVVNAAVLGVRIRVENRALAGAGQ